MSGAGRKIASQAVQNRKSTPLFDWLRRKLLAVDRDLTKTPPCGIPDADGQCVYYEHNRYPNTQASRSPDAPALPEGVHSKIAENYYYDRDARRSVEPPTPLYKSGDVLQTDDFKAKKHEEMAALAVARNSVNVGPNENFGLVFTAPTPGFGHEWYRSISSEEHTQKTNRDMKIFESFDAYKK